MSLVKELAQRSKRRLRSPEYDFHLRHRAFVLQPFMFAPVRPGETMKSILWQSRVVSDPLANPLMGWHIEYYWFYVQLQDCVPVGMEDTWLKPLWDPADNFRAHWPALVTALEMCTKGNDELAGFTALAYKRIVEEYFREEGEVWNSAHKMSGALALVRRNRKDAYESARSSWGDLPDVDVNIADGNLKVSEIRDALADYAMLMDTSMGSVTTFEDYLASQGQGRFSDVKRAYRPELIRVVKEWSYPTNTVNPQDGTPSSAVSWSIQSRADKDRYFKEPGFVVGLTVARPKTLRPQNDDPANYFRTMDNWLPKQSMYNPTAGVVAGINTHTQDLFEYGHQFINFDLAAYKANVLNWRAVDGTPDNDAGVYPVEASINANIWKVAASNNVRQDGKVAFNVLTDLPPDQIIGAGDNQEAVASDVSSIDELAAEYHAKLLERRKDRTVKLPNIHATLAALQESP